MLPIADQYLQRIEGNEGKMKSLVLGAAAAAIMSVAVGPSPAVAGSNFVERNYLGCATKSEMFGILRSAGLKPKKIVKVGEYFVLIRATELKTGDVYDYAVLPCQMMIDGRFPVKR
ncbi:MULTISPECIES: hypothetical protein [unclassified Devosia]|uniref:hypothetical protein n=1 Tax=unclassified Devosia TaxID=196773 RepID=UPI001AC368E3|nr:MULTISPECIES: hypothetical protein [unclassified Devosia]MBN9361729.1 hypothetical protein [Devosia sp.]